MAWGLGLGVSLNSMVLGSLWKEGIEEGYGSPVLPFKELLGQCGNRHLRFWGHMSQPNMELA